MSTEESRVPTKEEVENIKEWLKKQPHLPDVISDNLAKRFIHACHYDLPKTKSTLDLFYTIRHNAPEIFSDRDPLKQEIKNAFDIAYMCPLPQVTPENYKVFVYKMKDNNIDLFNFNDSTKAFLMLADARLHLENELTSGEVPIFDMDGVSLRYLTKLVYSTLKKYMQYTQEAHPVRIKQIHVINTLSFVDMLFNIVKPLIKSELIKIIHFHTPNSDTLYKFVPQEILPEEYGGKAGKLDDIQKHWINEVEKLRDFYLDESLWKIDESKRLTEDVKSSENEMSGIFTSLAID